MSFSPKRDICTYFDKNFLPRGLALLDSLEKNSDNFIVYILALDDETAEYLNNLNKMHIQVITLHQYSEYFSIDQTKFKNKKEFYFSLTPALCLYVLKHYSEIEILLYLDADVYLFSNLEILYKEVGEASIAMCSHRKPWYINLVSTNYGIYNVGVNLFRNDEEGNQCLEEWYRDCSEWKKGQEGYPLSYFSDQIWLDSWLQKYKSIKIIEHIGINVAPWNALQYKFRMRENRYYVDNYPLVIYHFSSLQPISEGVWHGNTLFTILNIKGELLNLYREYIKNLEKYNKFNTQKMLELEFSGNKLKILLYYFLKKFHNHIIKIK